MKQKVLLLGNNDRAFLSTLRELGNNYECYNIYFENKIFANKSKYLKKSFFISNPYKNLEIFENKLIKFLSKNKFEFIFPMTDIGNEIIHKNYDLISKYCKIVTVDKNKFELLKNKYKLLKIYQKLGFPTSNYQLITKENYSKINIKKFPKYLKPIYSVTSNDNFLVKHSVKKIKNKEDYEKIIRDNINNVDLILQDEIKGIGIGVNVLIKNGEILTYSVTKRIHEPKDGGGSSYRKSIKINKKLLNICEKLCKEINFTGLAMLEFKLSKGEYFLIEINPRVWGSIDLANFSNVNFQRKNIELIENKKTLKFKKYKTGKYSRNLIKDIAWLSKNPSKLFSWIYSFKNLISKNERFDVERINDIKPSIFQFYDILSNIIEKIKYLFQYFYFRIYFKIFSLNKNLKYKKGDKILFVCRGNINRSAFAKNYLEEKLNIKAYSSGFIFNHNRKTTKISENISIEKFNLDLSRHKSSFIFQIKDLNKFNIIYIFDIKNFIEMRFYFPQLINKTKFLSNKNIIKDPYSKSKILYFLTYKKIVESIKIEFQK